MNKLLITFFLCSSCVLVAQPDEPIYGPELPPGVEQDALPPAPVASAPPINTQLSGKVEQMSQSIQNKISSLANKFSQLARLVESVEIAINQMQSTLQLHQRYLQDSTPDKPGFVDWAKAQQGGRVSTMSAAQSPSAETPPASMPTAATV